jgi:hypothetical protein
MFAANAMAFLGLLVAFLLVLFAKGPESAGRVWTAPWSYLVIWPGSIVVCVRYLRT